MRSLLKSFGSARVRTPLSLPPMRIGLMGGSFDPPHEGHLVVAETALRRLGLDRVWWIVSPGNPLKSHASLPPLADRMAAAQRLARDPRIEVTGFEAALGSPYTAATVRFLKQRYPGVRFVWVMGADGLATFDRWRAWREIARMVPIAVIDRPEWRMKSVSSKAARWLARRRVPEAQAATLALARPPAWALLVTRLSPLSSTGLRQSAAVQSGAGKQPNRA